jgi:hypothetical protein
MKIEQFEQLDFGDIITNTRTKGHWGINRRIDDDVFEILSLEYFGKYDYINRNTCCDYELGDK